MKNDLTIVIATLNEVDNVAVLFSLIKEHLGEKILWEVVFVDDESEDGTVEKIEEIINQHSNARLIKRLGARGLSSALIQGALSSHSKYLLFMDGDLQHHPKSILEMYEEITNASLHIVSASRFLNQETRVLNSRRYKASMFVNKIINRLFSIHISDPLTGYFIVEKTFFDINVKYLSKRGFKLLTDLILNSKENLKIEEIPFTFKPRHSGASKLDNKIAIDFVYLIIDKLVGKIIPARYVLYSFVGLLGMLIQLTCFFVMYDQVKLGFLASNAISVFVAMYCNYNINNMFTYSDLRLKGRNYIKGMFLFCFFCSFGAVINLLTAKLALDIVDIELVSVFIGAAIGSIWNYSMNTSFNWKAL